MTEDDAAAGVDCIKAVERRIAERLYEDPQCRERPGRSTSQGKAAARFGPPWERPRGKSGDGLDGRVTVVEGRAARATRIFDSTGRALLDARLRF